MSLNLDYSDYNDEGFPTDMDYDDDSADYFFEDDTLLMLKLLTDLKGEEVTEDDLSDMYDRDDPLIYEAYNDMYALASKAAEGHSGGIVYIAADESCKWYASQEEMILEHDLRFIRYADENAAFIAFVKEKTGETITEEDIRGIYWGNNMELWDAYMDLYLQMDEYYLGLLGAHPMGYVGPDGVLAPVDDIDSFYASVDGDEGALSIAANALLNKTGVTIGDCELVFDLDAEGRITAVSADVALDFVNRNGSVHPVTMKLTAKATAYGETEVGDFDPEKWGVPDFAEYYHMVDMGLVEEDDDDTASLPETVTLNGVVYPVFAE